MNDPFAVDGMHRLKHLGPDNAQEVLIETVLDIAKSLTQIDLAMLHYLSGRKRKLTKRNKPERSCRHCTYNIDLALLEILFCCYQPDDVWVSLQPLQ